MADYTIQRGDCLWSIAKRQYGNELKSNSDIQKAVNKLAEINNIKNPNLIYTGNTLQLPDSVSIFSAKADENGLLDTSNIKDEPRENILTETPAGNEPTGTVLDLSKFVNGQQEEVLAENLYEKFNKWTQQASDDFLKNGLNKDPEGLRAGYDEIEGRTFDFNKTESENPRQDGVLELAEGQMASYDKSKDGYIDLDEYMAGNLEEANSQYSDYELTLDPETYQGLKNSFEFFDFNHDNKLESDELKAYYNLLDTSDGTQDGVFGYKEYLQWGNIASNEGDVRDEYKAMLDNLFKESYPKQI